MATSTTLVVPRTQWLNTVEFPFEPRAFQTADGNMHYVDVGRGRPIVFLHGSPTWSFLFRNLLKGLSPRFRCIAVDHLGLGLSDKPREADYRPRAHTARLEALITSLGLQNVTLVGHDFGASIGLDFAGKHPDMVRDIVLMNTWLWSLAHNPVSRFVSNTAASPINQYWFRLLNPSPKFYLPVLFADNHRLPKWVQDQYQNAFNNQFETYCPEALARALTNDEGWFEVVRRELGEARNKPCLILWGDQDIAYGEGACDRLGALLPNAAIVRLPGVGNYVPEEAPEQCIRHITRFLA